MSLHTKPELGLSPSAKRKVEINYNNSEIEVDWDTFFELVLDEANWKEVELGKDQYDGRECKLFEEDCTYGDLDEGVCESTFKLFRFESLDNNFDGEFSLCDYCLETSLSDYVEGWLSDMSDDYKRDIGNGIIRIDMLTLGPTDQTKYLRLKQIKK